MAGKLGIAGRQAHALLLSLDEQQFIELRSASVKASRFSATQIAMCVSSNSLNLGGRARAD